MKKIFLRAPAKLNLFLEVFPRKGGKSHPVCSIMDKITLFDELTFKESKRVQVISSEKSLTSKENLVLKAASLFKEKFGVSNGVTIFLKKRIPVSSGLGGGSSDGASTLIGLSKLWNLELTKEDLLPLAKEIGSDVPFFLYPGRCLVEGIGEKVTPLPSSPKLWYLLILPDFPLSTKKVYQKLDLTGSIEAIKMKSIDKSKRTDRLLNFLRKGNNVVAKLALPILKEIAFNRLEEVAYEEESIIKEWKEWLLDKGVMTTLMSGSGASTFGIVRSEEEAENIASQGGEISRGKLVVVSTWRENGNYRNKSDFS